MRRLQQYKQLQHQHQRKNGNLKIAHSCEWHSNGNETHTDNKYYYCFLCKFFKVSIYHFDDIVVQRANRSERVREIYAGDEKQFVAYTIKATEQLMV